MRRSVLAGFVGLLLVTAPAISACAKADDLIISPDGDAQVDAAIVEARKTLPIFWSKFDAKPAGYDHFALKVGLPAGGGGEEHIWMNVVSRSGGKVVGELANDPYDLEGLKSGSRVEVDEALISDWQYQKGGKLYGHFTTRALSSRANAAQRAEAAELFPPQPLEAGND